MNEPFRKDEVEEYESKRYRGLDQWIVDAREQRILRKFLQQIVKKGERALDLPCGYGRFSKLLRKQGLKPVNSDISFFMVKRACDKGRSIGLQEEVGVVTNAIQGLPFKNSIFQIVFSLRFFHHLHEGWMRELTLKEFSRVSKNWVILSFYKKNLLHKIQRQLRGKVKKSSTRINMLSKKKFIKEINLSGLTIVQIIPIFKGLHAQHIALLRKKE